jgi:tetratricopeptide (TPR) repeat protein
LGKGFLILLILIFIFAGIYGTSHFLKLQKAEDAINDAVIEISEGNYRKAISGLKDVISIYDIKIVKAPAIYLLGETYEKTGEYNKAIEAHQNLISDRELTEAGNWYIQSVISLSRLYRQGVSNVSPQKTEIVENSLISMIEKVKEETQTQESIETFGSEVKRLLNALVNINYNLAIQDLSYDELLVDLQTELGFIYLQKKEYERAEDILIKLESPTAKFGLAQIYLESGNERKGLALLEDVIKYDNTSKIQSYYIKKAFNYAENLYTEGKFTESIEIFKRIIELEDRSEYAESSLYYIAKYYYNLKNSTSSLKYINSILSNSIRTKDEEAQLLKGYIYYDRRDYIGALKIFHDFLKKYPYSERAKTAHEWKSMCERSIKYLG